MSSISTITTLGAPVGGSMGGTAVNGAVCSSMPSAVTAVCIGSGSGSTCRSARKWVTMFGRSCDGVAGNQARSLGAGGVWATEFQHWSTAPSRDGSRCPSNSGPPLHAAANL